MSTADAKKILLENMEAEMKEETGRRIREWEATLQQQANEKVSGNPISGYSAFCFRNCLRNHRLGGPDSQR